MKLILTQEVSGLGSAGDIIEVKDGYGRNYLVPRGLAIKWSKGGESQVAALRRGRDVREVKDLGEAKAIAESLSGLSVKLSSRAGEGGRLFGSVTTADVVEAVAAAGGPKLDKRRVELPSAHIKTVGSHTVSVRLHPEVTASVAIEVTAS
ncbi:MAG TPA: 50S ribosomal protein L9 [Mycobacteriales bacterium]|jgi:large subunit ribosomal protein L9|nr:50S ribosomal protein L9 [Mycobacteriales bacterium]HVX70353.1 50S ribosomal protein L9 [Mycobacteriales bacterium]